MRKSKKKVLLLVLVAILVVIAVTVIFKFKILADTISLPSWIDSQTISKYSTWTTAQKLPFDRCVSNGNNSKSVLTPAEQAQFGANSVAFNVSPIVSVGSSSPYWDWYQSSYRLIITPVKYDLQSDGSHLVKLRITLSNPGNNPIIVGNPEARYYFWYLNGSVPTSGNMIFTRGVDYTYTLLPGEYVTKDSLEFKINDAAYWGVELSNWLYTTTSGSPVFSTPVWDSAKQKTDATLSCIINPMAIANLVPGAIPSATASQTAMPGSRPVTFHKGFNAFGNFGGVNADMIGSNGMTIYRFNGSSNSWQWYPGGGNVFNLESGNGSYVYNPGDAKTVRFQFGPSANSTYQLTQGWNMLWSGADKSMSDLNFYYNQQTASASTMISSGTIKNNIFIIDNDSATTPCTYFKLLSSSNSSGNCSGGVAGLAKVDKILAGKTFWVYAN